MASERPVPTAYGAPIAGQWQAGADSERPSGRGEMSEGERRLLAAMPLHAITALHGEAGLRERFAIEIASFPDGDRLRVERALELAARLHAGDRRQREPYVNHLLRVAIRIITYYGVRDADVICAALLHDAVEDHAEQLAPAAASRMPSPRWPRSSGTGWPTWWRRSPTRRTSPDVTATSSTASTSPPAWKPARGPGSSRPQTSPTTASASSTPPGPGWNGSPTSTPRSYPSSPI